MSCTRAARSAVARIALKPAVQSRTPLRPAIQRARRLPHRESWRRRKPQLSSTEPPGT